MKALRFVLFLFLAPLVIFVAGRARREPLRVALADEPPRHAFRVLFGAKDTAEQKWDGRIEVRGGKLLRLEGWRFWQSDRIDGDRFRLTTRVGQMEDQLHPNKVFPGRVDRLIPAAVMVTLEGDGAEVMVESAAGHFSFRENEIAYGQPAEFLNGRVRVERVPAAERLSGPDLYDDYPSLAVTRQGETWVSWIAYREASDYVVVRRQSSGEWLPPEAWREPSSAAADYFRTAVAEDSAGRVWVVWAAQVEGAWNLYGRAFENGKWSATESLTAGAGPNLFHKLVRAADGRLYLAWQGFRNGVSSILLKSYDGKRWSRETLLSQRAGSSWEPSLAADSKGRVWAAWDGYGAGNYDIYVREIASGKPGPLFQVTHAPNFEAHADISCDAQDRPWIAWDEGGPNWGKDWSHDVPRGTLLYSSRKLRVAYRDQGEWREPQVDVMQAVPAEIRGWAELPQIHWEGSRLWLVYRDRTDTLLTRPDNFAAGGNWHFYATCLLGDRWLPALLLPASVGRQYMRAALATAPGARGGLLVAWPTDGRPFRGAGGGIYTAPPRELDVYFSRLELPASVKPANSVPSRPLVESRAEAPAVHPGENLQIARVAQYRVRSGGKTYRILRGDMHRHTELSSDGSGDGSLFDLYRYAMDAARLDYVLVGDHQMGNGDEYSWWITQKSNDMFYVNGAFLPLYGYERSVAYPNGHRNLVFPKRGVRALPISQEENKGSVNSGPLLYPHLRQHGAIAMEHSLATSQGTDWRDNDPELEPLAEIYQGYHSSYEYEGAPKTESDATGHVHGSYEPAGFFWNALAKGYKLGVQASSDHISTHVSYACILTEDVSRQGLMDAMKQRHAYAATDNIILDYRMLEANGREHLQGDIFSASGAPPRIVVKIIGTAPIQKVDLVKNNKFILTRSPGQPAFDLTYQDQEVQPGESYYYVRVIQQDGQMAWSSPIWVKYR